MSSSTHSRIFLKVSQSEMASASSQMARRLGVIGGNWSSQVINNVYAWFTTMGLPASYNTNAQHTLLMSQSHSQLQSGSLVCMHFDLPEIRRKRKAQNYWVVLAEIQQRILFHSQTKNASYVAAERKRDSLKKDRHRWRKKKTKRKTVGACMHVTDVCNN